MPNPRPDFAQFADEMAYLAEEAEYPLNTLAEQAERHARLLETIQTWAESATKWQPFDRGYEDIDAAKAHIRSLLEQG